MVHTLRLPRFDKSVCWEAAYADLQQLLRRPQDPSLTLDLSYCTFIPAEGVLTLLNLGRLWHRQTNGVVTMTGLSQTVHQYLERMNLFVHAAAYLQTQEPLGSHLSWGRAHNSDTLLELHSIACAEQENTRDVTLTIQHAMRILATWLAGDELTLSRICTILSELATNVVHSQDRGYILMQRYADTSAYPRGSKISIAIADLGRGIEATLPHQKLSRTPRRTGSEALLYALQPGVSSRKTVAGMGLYQIQRLVQDWQGVLSIRSHMARVTISAKHCFRADDLTRIPGTQVSLLVRGATRS